MKLISIPKNKYDEYRLDVIFKGYKWDPQFVDNNTISRHFLVLNKREAAEIQGLTEKLCAETINAENVLLNNLKLTRSLLLHRQTRGLLKRMSNYSKEKHIRLMRFDFHPLAQGGWAVSEVNSDVPGGFAEASMMPRLAADLFDNNFTFIDFIENLKNAFLQKVEKGGTIAIVHCTSYSDDRQVMQFVGDNLEELGYKVLYVAADHLNFKNNLAVSLLDGRKGGIDGILRFTPVEWFIGLKKAWHGYFDTLTPSCNHPIGIFAQTKRFPFVWDRLEKLGVDLSTWKALLPPTFEVRCAKNIDGIIYKPVNGRVGEGISIKSAITDEEYGKILKSVKRRPKRYIAQKMFDGLPLTTDEGESYHVCLGSYSVERRAAGFYARISKTARIDSYAEDVGVLIEK